MLLATPVNDAPVSLPSFGATTFPLDALDPDWARLAIPGWLAESVHKIRFLTL